MTENQELEELLALVDGLGVCRYKGCDEPVGRTRGWCIAHYGKIQKYGDPDAGRRYQRRLAECAVEDCPEPVFATGWCDAHYAKAQKYGDPEGGMQCATEGCVTRTINDREHCRAHTQCSVDDCISLVGDGSNGLCVPHYTKDLKYGDPLAGGSRVRRYSPDAICASSGCDLAPSRRGWCSGHYERVRNNNGDPMAHLPLKRPLTEDDVRTIKAALVAGETGSSLAGRFDVSPSTISNIAKGHTWKHVA